MPLSEFFKRDNEWQRRLAIRFLDPFYRQRGWRVTRYPDEHPMQRLHVDVMLTKGEEVRRVDEKILHGLRKGGPAEKLNFEIMSCTVPGRERRGWGHPEEPNRSTHLFVSHAEDVSEISPDSWKRVLFLECAWMPFPELRTWFWEMGGDKRWPTYDNEQGQEGICSKVPFAEIAAANLGLKRFRIDIPLSDATFTGYCDCGAPGLYVVREGWQCNEHRTV